MLNITQLIDRKIEETFRNTSISFKTSKFFSHASKQKTGMSPKPVPILTPNNLRKNCEFSLPKATTTRGTDKYSSDCSTSLGRTLKTATDPYRLHKKLALLNHPLWIESIREWWIVMGPQSDKYDVYKGIIHKERYLELNVRMQKTMNEEFTIENAWSMANEDWEMDADDWGIEQILQVTGGDKHRGKSFNFDKFSEFLLDIGEVWSNGSIESILILVNIAFLSITAGVHINSSGFKEIDDINPIGVQIMQEVGVTHKVSPVEFSQWYQKSFCDLDSMKNSLVKKLNSFIPDEARIKDLWVMCYKDRFPEILLQSVRGIDNLLKRIQESNAISLPINDQKKLARKEKRNKTSNAFHTPERKPTKAHVEKDKHQENPNSQAKYSKQIALLGKRCKLTEDSPSALKRKSIPLDTMVSQDKNPNETTQTYNDKLSTQLFEPETLLSHSTSRSKSVPVEAENTLLSNSKPLESSRSQIQIGNAIPRLTSGKNSEPEYTPKLKFKKSDIVYHKLQKQWRTGVFEKPKISKISSENYQGDIKDNRKDKNKKNYEYKYRNSSCSEMKSQQFERNYNDRQIQNSTCISWHTNTYSETNELQQLVGVKIMNPYQHNDIQLPKIDKLRKDEATGTVSNNTPNCMTRKSDRYYSLEGNHYLNTIKKPEKLIFHNEIDYLYAMNQTKYDFNALNQSEYLKNYKSVKNEYRSRRDELGGTITAHDWSEFISRLEILIKITERRRKNRLNRLRKRDSRIKKSLKGPYGQKKRLWQNIFIKPENQELVNQTIYERELNKLQDNQYIEGLPKELNRIIYSTDIEKLTSISERSKVSEKRNKLPARLKLGSSIN